MKNKIKKSLIGFCIIGMCNVSLQADATVTKIKAYGTSVKFQLSNKIGGCKASWYTIPSYYDRDKRIYATILSSFSGGTKISSLSSRNYKKRYCKVYAVEISK